MSYSTHIRSRNLRGSNPRWPFFVFVLLAAGLLLACPPAETPEDDIVDDGSGGVATVACEPATGEVDLGCTAPPNTFDTTSLEGTDNGSAWDAWAWSSFAAYNWPALTSDDATTYPTGYVRGVPDAGASFVGASSTDVTVWETFKEKRELFNDLATSDAWQDLTFDPQYAPSSQGGDIVACSDADQARLEELGDHVRVIAQISKQESAEPSAGGSSSADETAEVASPAQESTDTLCAGYSGNDLESCENFLFEPIDGDKSKELSATGANPRDNPVGPRVFAGTPSSDAFVYYEVKLNYDYYSYVAANGLNDYATAVTKADAAEIHLPYRTTAASPPGGENSDAILSYDAQDTATCYGQPLDQCSFSNQTGIGPDHLPQVGSVQLKAAWLPSDQLDLDGYTLDDYHTTEAVYYQSDSSQSSGLCYAVQEFGLIGLHIIQRVHGGSGTGSAEQIGGTFVFATWEHESIADGAGYTYVNYLSNFGHEQSNPNPYPNTGDGIQVSRLQSYPLASTTTVNQTAHSELGDSVWANYRLVGTQFQAISSESDSTALGQPYYLANLVIETNRGLQQFQGQPPGVTPISHYSSAIPETFQFYSPTTNNMAWAGSDQGYVMGGCMGCHGVAQSLGFNFSFVLQDGSKGTKPDTADDVLIPPVPVSTSSD